MSAASLPSLQCIVYVSSAVWLWSPEELEALLAVSRQRNQSVSLTGLLLYCDGSIMQCLEGPSQAVKDTMKRVERDPRHHSIFVLFDEPVAERQFSAWTMASSRVSAPDYAFLRSASWPGVARGFGGTEVGSASGSSALRLLSSFWNTNR